MKIKIKERELIIKYRGKKYLEDINDKICENTLGMNLNEIIIKYKIEKEDKRIRIFGDNFVNNNYNNCKIILNGKKYNLISHLDIKDKIINEKLMAIKLRGIKKIKKLVDLFAKCSSLKSLSDISNWNTNNITDISGLFYECSSLNHYLIYQNRIQIM